MKSADIPLNELERLADLSDYGISQHFRDEEFNDLTRLAAMICHTPISAITIVDAKRQWFKSSQE